ncbi:MAG: TonB-dependent receptor plug domain-containing protein [Acidobacteriota bacterium]|nr:TonB-dependent receptor plug domain-containing protein [Acidobacteriota bacterium]
MQKTTNLRAREITGCPRRWTLRRLTPPRFSATAIQLVAALVLSAVTPAGLFGQGSGRQSGTVDITQSSIEDLMNIQVTSVSKKEQPLARTGAAVFVITQEDIHDSGATNIPDVLRMAPGVDVAQIDANHWAIGIRGFNAVFTNTVLVLIDGRSVYSAAIQEFSGINRTCRWRTSSASR